MPDYIQVCSSIDAGGLCDGTITYSPAYLLPPDSATQLGLLLGGGFDVQMAEIGFLGVITLFATGLAVGTIISVIKKLR